jgi:WD repeat-containing protein 92
MEKTQIICLIEKSLPFSIFDVKWIPCSAKVVVLGTNPRSTGAIQIFELNGTELSLLKEVRIICHEHCVHKKAHASYQNFCKLNT